MFKLIVIAFISLWIVYYIDIVTKVTRDDKEGKFRYKGFKLIIPFAYWLFPYKEKPKAKKRKSSVKSKTQKDEAK